MGLYELQGNLCYSSLQKSGKAERVGNSKWGGFEQKKNMNKKSTRFFNDREVRAVWDEERSKWWFL